MTAWRQTTCESGDIGLIVAALLAGLLAAVLAAHQKKTRRNGCRPRSQGNRGWRPEGRHRAVQEDRGEARTNRAAVAKALVQMGQCYEKLGEAEAAQLTSGWCANTPISRSHQGGARAAERPHRWGRRSHRPHRGGHAPDLDREGLAGRPLPGWPVCRFYSSYVGVDLWLRDLQSGEQKANHQGGFVAGTCRTGAVISPDGKWIAYHWWVGAA